MNLHDIILGRPLANREQESRRIGWFEAVPAMGLDGLGSASYGPEAALTVLAPLGIVGLAWIGPIMAAIVGLLLVLYLSYRQTIVAYQTNGGAYTVSRENLGTGASLVAAAALMIDYVLNVAVGISAGVGALTSALPSLQSYTLALCLGILALVTLANLRGVGEAGLLFALPTYLFIASFLGLIAVGLAHALASGGRPHPLVAPPPAHAEIRAITAWAIMRAFAAGCTAMTGVEAVSNGVGAFRPPVVGNAHRTLTIICGTLGLLLAGVATLAHAYGLTAMDQTRPDYQSLLSQLTAAVAGRGPVYYVAMASVLAVLCLSANTSYVGFPRLCRLVAQDAFLPRPFALPDRRLVFSVGIGFLTVSAGALLIIFKGVTDRLIPLFAIGAFLTFTLSQAGMVAYWLRSAKDADSRRGAWRRLTINAVGALVTAAALTVIVTTKFADGAWIVVIAIPLAIGALAACRRYYERLDTHLAAEERFSLVDPSPPTVLVLIEHRSRMSDRALNVAMSLSPEVIAIHLTQLEGPEDSEDARAIKRRWAEDVEGPLAAEGRTPPRLVLLPAPMRQIHEPLLAFIDKLDAATPGRAVAVMIPELVLRHPFEQLMHARRAERLRKALLAHGGPRLNVIIAPWRRAK